MTSDVTSAAAGDGFDRVTFRAPDGGTRDLTRDQFMALPLGERIEAILHGKPSFWNGAEPVAARAALKSIQ